VVKQQPVSVGWQVVFLFIPYVWIYAFYRIEKLLFGIVIALVSLAITTGIQMVLPFPFGFILAFFTSFFLPIYFIVNWSREWNAKF